MADKPADVVALGTCYIDTNVENYPFDSDGIASETELVGGQYEMVPGGSAVNFCRQLAELGLQTIFIGMAGNDVNGDILTDLLAQHDVQSALIRRSELSTNIGFNITNAAGQHIMLSAGTANVALSPEYVMPKLEALIPKTKICYLGGCFKLKAFESSFATVARLAKDHATTLIVDHGRLPGGVKKSMINAVRKLVLQTSYYLPSHNEFCQLWDVATIKEGLQKLNHDAPNLIVVVKDGANGAFYWKDGAMQHVPAEPVKSVSNATGVGDSFNAGLIAAVLNGRDISQATAFGCKVAAAKIKGRATPIPR